MPVGVDDCARSALVLLLASSHTEKERKVFEYMPTKSNHCRSSDLFSAARLRSILSQNPCFLFYWCLRKIVCGRFWCKKRF